MNKPAEEDVVQTVRDLAAESPDFVYTPSDDVPGCSYFPDEHNPQGCIVGAAFHRLGIEIPESLEGAAPINLFAALVDEEVGFFSERMRWLKDCQSYQDTGATWSAAVGAADRIREETKNG